MSGVNCIADLKDRCRVDDITGCWHWGGALTQGRPPSLRFPPLGNRVLTLGAVIGFFRTGEGPSPGVYWVVTCGTLNCANPAHRKAGDRAFQMGLIAKGKPIKPLHRQRITASRRKGSKLTDEQVADILHTDDRLQDAAARHGISLTYVSKIRRGEKRVAMVAPGASVFAWAGGAL